LTAALSGTSITCTLNPVTTDQYGKAVLYTGGKAYEEASLSSANMQGVGLTQTYGIFEAAIYLSGNNGNIADFPAFWLSGVGNTWPVGGEFDIFEGLSGNAQSHYHANLGGGNVSSVAGTAESLSVPGWHVFTGVWEQGYLAAYFDGVHVFDYYNTAVEGDAPLQVIVDNATESAGSASTDYVGWFRDYAWSGQ
jgi:hypothetical protein